ncbi:MBL fold metallo-hydrolase [Cytophagales bacterium LB-30]|uniref:MBL fold metallo-hydrolase n=1 Tax=Shiella aurantiaca TaxID=3058365 RepID=A0ABT8F3J7_9BACT|nr:MBL fold metallo-hydrolase [Shiella aurantiaca]MDN4165030.1 MBL fold metallo-hydrolase [Shiella aurantiaca]
MKKLKKLGKIMLIGIVSALALIGVGGFLFIKMSPQFGGKPSPEQVTRYVQSGHYEKEKGVFVNLIPTAMDMDFGTVMSLLRDYWNGIPNKKPKGPLPVEKIDSLEIVQKTDTLTRLTWFGHSAFLLEMQGKNILLDPMLGDSPAPHPTFGTSRFTKELPIAIEQLPYIDFVLFSHDHYDHLDYGSIQKLKDKVGHFYTPLGVGNHLIAWGVAPEKVTELNWWDEVQVEGFTLACTPSRHFSGRGLTDRNSTLWSSWVILTEKERIYFSGDSGYGPHFKTIGEKYGPFDLAMMECGQYDTRWQNIHMMPEETVQAAQDVQAKLMMPIHWGAFTLSLHSWTDPVERAIPLAKSRGLATATPKIGEALLLNHRIPNTPWWESVKP